MQDELSALLTSAQQQNEQAMEDLVRFFKPKVIAIAREYFLIGAEFDDLIQEGMIGLYKAIQIYDKNKNHNFGAFASLCIHRQLQNAVKSANRMKNAPLNKYIPINYYGGGEGREEDKQIKIVIVDDNSDIEKEYIDKELNAIVISKVKNILTDEQFEMLKMFINGASYTRMAEHFDISTKQVDNTLQSIKKKLRSIKGEI